MLNEGVPAAAIEETAYIGELGLDGTVRSVTGTLALVDAVRARGGARVVVPAADAHEAALVPGITDSHVHPLMGALDARGADLLDAFTIGVELECRLSKGVSVPPAKGPMAWSGTGISAGFGTAAAIGPYVPPQPITSRSEPAWWSTLSSGMSRAMRRAMPRACCMG